MKNIELIKKDMKEKGYKYIGIQNDENNKPLAILFNDKEGNTKGIIC